MPSQLTILLVDDEQDFLDGMNERMQLKGFKTLTATSGDEALALARENTIHAAIVDLKMPGMDGLVCIAKLKEIHHDLKTVLLTGFGDAKVREATEGLESVYFEKGEMNSFWHFIKALPQKLETSMASAAFAEAGDHKDAMEILEQDK